MALNEEFRNSGNWLFRRRGFLPIFILLAGLLFLFFHLQNHPITPPLWYELLCLSTSFLGLFIRILTIGYTPKHTSGRNIRQQKANVLNTSGIYSMLRHPLYLGNFFMWFGLALFVYHTWFVLLSVLVFWLYYERIMFAEEAFLLEKFGADYSEWSSRTPAFIPSLKHYRPSSLAFSWRNIFKREYNGMGNMVASFTLIAGLRATVLAGKIQLPLHWIIIFGAGLLTWLILRILEKNTRLFEVEGR